MMRNKIFWLAGITAIAGAILVFYIFFNKDKAGPILANATSQTVTSQASWQGGENSALLDTATSAGDIKINISGGITQVDTSSASFSADVDGGNASKIMDGNDGTGWGFTSTYVDECHWVKVDLGSAIVGISRIRNQGGGDADSSQEIFFSEDDLTYNSIYTGGGGSGVPWVYDIPTPQTVRYVKVEACNNWLFTGGDDPVGESELTLYQGPFLATNKETLDGGVNFWEWENFQSKYALEANSSVKYRFRTSVDGLSWTSWSGYQTPSSEATLDISGIVTSRSGDDDNNPTRYRYLQVETTLQNTDGAHTPTVDYITQNYHTEQKPGAPSAQTAVVQ